MESLAEDFKLSACGRQPSSFYSLSFDLVVWFLFLFCFSGQASANSSLGSVLIRHTQLVPPIRYCISGHIRDNVSF
jgi:hypothetical protein